MLDAQFWWEIKLGLLGFAAGIVFTLVIARAVEAIDKWHTARRAPDPYEAEFKGKP